MKKSKKGYNTLAILALIFAFVFYPIGLIFGIIALNQIKKTGEKGRWMCGVPIVFGLVLLLLIILAIIWYLTL